MVWISKRCGKRGLTASVSVALRHLELWLALALHGPPHGGIAVSVFTFEFGKLQRNKIFTIFPSRLLSIVAPFYKPVLAICSIFAFSRPTFRYTLRDRMAAKSAFGEKTWKAKRSTGSRNWISRRVGQSQPAISVLIAFWLGRLVQARFGPVSSACLDGACLDGARLHLTSATFANSPPAPMEIPISGFVQKSQTDQ